MTRDERHETRGGKFSCLLSHAQSLFDYQNIEHLEIKEEAICDYQKRIEGKDRFLILRIACRRYILGIVIKRGWFMEEMASG